MNKTFGIGFVVVYVAMQIAGFVIHELMLGDTYDSLLLDSFCCWRRFLRWRCWPMSCFSTSSCPEWHRLKAFSR